MAHVYDETTPSIATLAAKYAIALVRNHPFVDGNTRVGFVTLELFLSLNGHSFAATDEACIENIVRLAAKEHSDETFTAWVVSETRKAREGTKRQGR